MANIAVINCLSLSRYAGSHVDGEKSSIDLVLDFAGGLPDTNEVICLVDALQQDDDAFAPLRRLPAVGGVSTPAELFSALQELCAGRSDLDSVFYFYGDTPLLDSKLTKRMWENHRRYHADYTFSDAYPAGIAPEILRASAVAPLAHLAQGMTGHIKRDTVFETLRKDINAFEIETAIPSIDLRLLRIRLAAENRSGYMLVKRVMESGVREAESLLHYLNDNRQILRTLPAYLSVQITAGCPQACSYCPYPSFGGDILHRRESMPLDRFRTLLENFSDFAGTGYINLSPWGEPSLHPEIESVLDTVLAHPGFSAVIETSGLGWGRKVLERLAQRGGERLIWIVSLDALKEETYRTLRGEGFAEAQTTAGALLELFPATAYVQAVRMDTNEEELELFYRTWKERTENIIIQKYDYFSGRLPQRRVADISPLKRNPCWHLKRDLTVLLNGDVPLCREDLDTEHLLGNVFADGFDTVWSRGEEFHLRHIKGDYPKICRECDEYYTFNY